MTDINVPLVDARHHARLTEIRRWADKIAPHWSRWRTRSRYFHKADEDYLRFLIPENLHVLELGCGTGDTLAALKPQFGLTERGLKRNKALLRLEAPVAQLDRATDF